MVLSVAYIREPERTLLRAQLLRLGGRRLHASTLAALDAPIDTGRLLAAPRPIGAIVATYAPKERFIMGRGWCESPPRTLYVQVIGHLPLTNGIFVERLHVFEHTLSAAQCARRYDLMQESKLWC